jgi:SOS response regulatory protein OraA/RecX
VPPSAYDKAVQLLGVRPHFRRELGAKLARRGFPPEEVEAALDRLTEQGYLDDRQAAAGFVQARLARGGEGRARLRAELQKRGADPEAASDALAEMPDDDLPAAREAAAAWDRRGGKDPMALARHLARKGFTRRAIFALLKERPGGDPPEKTEPEKAEPEETEIDE